jgi:Lrp/AsnC family transcriptional regulator for asnA, asnC and gidA
LDDFDHRLISVLMRDSRQSNREIGRQLDVSETTIRSRLKRLTDSGLLRLTALVDPVVLGTVGSVAFCFVKAERTKVKPVLKALQDLPQCWQLSQCIGRYDLEMLVVCQDRAELVDTLMGIRAMKGIRRSATMEVIDVPHHAYHWARFLT